jgi:hypothetical protein
MQLNKNQCNILNAFILASDTEVLYGKHWYAMAHEICKDISIDTGKDFIKVCGIFSALSVSTNYKQTIKDTQGFLKDMYYKCSTYGQQVIKADKIYSLEKPTVQKICQILKGQKTIRFFLNIYSERYPVITIDRHMIALYHGTFQHNFIETPKRMKRIRKDIKQIAEYLNLKPYELQATVWLVWKRINNI